MLFNSYIFIFIFLPITLVIYYSLLKGFKNKYIAKSFLIISSLVFYGYWNEKYLPLILISIIVNFSITLLMRKKYTPFSNKLLLIIGIILNISLLGYFKYFDFFISNFNQFFLTNLQLLQLALPLAISFFTFQQIAYLVDSYREETSNYNIIDYCLFVTFFPQLIAGPIVHHSEIISQLKDKENFKIITSNISTGIYIFAIGLFKKVIIADTFAGWANKGYENISSLTFVDSWITTLAYTFQLYFDFSGYCDMAIGLALLFNIKLPINFNSPYKSLTIQDFWRRWHMTLGRFFTNYLYYPLGGNRKGPIRTYFHLFFIFLVSGLWHGAGWTFIIWGLLHGLASIIYRFWSNLKLFSLPKLFAWGITFLFVHVAWVYFRSPNVQTAHQLIGKMFNFTSVSFPEKIGSFLTRTFNIPFTIETYMFDLKLIPLFVLTLLIATFAKNSIQLSESFVPNYKNALFISLITVVSLLYLDRISEFLYFNF